MKPQGNEIVIHYTASKIKVIIFTVFWFAVLIWLMDLIWFEALDVPEAIQADKFRISRVMGRYFFIKYFGIPFMLLIGLALLKIVLTPQLVEMRVGEAGVWKRSLVGKETFVSWEEINAIRFNFSKNGDSLIFSVQNLIRYPLLLLEGGLTLSQTVLATPLADTIETLRHNKKFVNRYQAKQTLV